MQNYDKLQWILTMEEGKMVHCEKHNKVSTFITFPNAKYQDLLNHQGSKLHFQNLIFRFLLFLD